MIWDYDLASRLTYVMCFNFIRKWRDLQPKINSEWQIFEKLFMAISFTLRVFAKNQLSLIFRILGDVWPGGNCYTTECRGSTEFMNNWIQRQLAAVLVSKLNAISCKANWLQKPHLIMPLTQRKDRNGDDDDPSNSWIIEFKDN